MDAQTTAQCVTAACEVIRELKPILAGCGLLVFVYLFFRYF